MTVMQASDLAGRSLQSRASVPALSVYSSRRPWDGLGRRWCCAGSQGARCVEGVI